MRKFLLNRRLVLAMALWAVFLGVCPTNGFAFPTQSLASLAPSAAREYQINKIMDVLSRPEARLHLQLMKLNEQDVRSSLTKLDDSQLTQVAQRADAVKAAGDGALGVIIALLIITLLVVLILRVSDKKVVVSKA